MKSKIKNKKSKIFRKGFTLIELLIVITIIGILAVAILSAIDPIEQIRRATDQGKESDAAELLNGLERYFTGFQEYPWDALKQAKPNSTVVQLSWIDELIGKGEMKSQFKDRDSLGSIYVTESSGGTVSVCFDPASKTFQAQANNLGKNQDGSDGCTANCWVCLPR